MYINLLNYNDQAYLKNQNMEKNKKHNSNPVKSGEGNILTQEQTILFPQGILCSVLSKYTIRHNVAQPSTNPSFDVYQKGPCKAENRSVRASTTVELKIQLFGITKSYFIYFTYTHAIAVDLFQLSTQKNNINITIK